MTIQPPTFPPRLAARWKGRRYFSFGQYLQEQFGEKVFKIGINAGFTCPNRDGTRGRGGCIYCDNQSFLAGQEPATVPITNQVEKGVADLERRYNAARFLVYFQSFSNTYGPVEQLEARYREALAHSQVVGLALGTRPDCLPKAVLKLLEQLNRETHLWVEVGLQSATDQILARINRGHSVAEFEAACRALKTRGIRVCAHLILGLPGESRDSMLAGIDLINNLHLDGIKLHQLHVVEGTELARQYAAGEIRCLDLEEYLELTAACLERLAPTVVVHRLFGIASGRRVLAPAWGLNKNQMLQRCRLYLEEKDSWQGKGWLQ